MSKFNEPWNLGWNSISQLPAVVDSNGAAIFNTLHPEKDRAYVWECDKADVERILLCVNACAHMSDETLQCITSGKLTLMACDPDEFSTMDTAPSREYAVDPAATERNSPP